MATGIAAASRLALRDPDVRLMLRLRRGNVAAFPELLKRYRQPVFQQLYLVVGNREEAEDLTQEVFLRVFRHRYRYRARAKFATWLFHIVRNIGRNALRSRRRRPSFPVFFAGADSSRPGMVALLSDPRSEMPSQPLERREIGQIVRSALARLAGRQRTALELQQFEDRSYAEIADQLSLTPEAAKSLLYRARNHLREELLSYMRD